MKRTTPCLVLLLIVVASAGIGYLTEPPLSVEDPYHGCYSWMADQGAGATLLVGGRPCLRSGGAVSRLEQELGPPTVAGVGHPERPGEPPLEFFAYDRHDLVVATQGGVILFFCQDPVWVDLLRDGFGADEPALDPPR